MCDYSCSRISASDKLEESQPNEPSWRVEDTTRLAHILAEHGIYFVDVFAGGNAAEQSFKAFNAKEPGYQALFAEAVKKSGGGISSGKATQKILEDGKADIVLCGRWCQKNPTLVW